MPEDTTLTKLQKNAVYRVFQTRNLDATEFEWRTVTSHETNRLETLRYTASSLFHVPTASYYTFGGSTDKWSPGAQGKVESRGHGEEGMPGRLHSVGVWADRVKREHDAPDLWTELRNAGSTNLGGDQSQNSPFSDETKKRIIEQIAQVEALLLAQASESEVHREFVTEKLGYLRESVSRLGRSDWGNVCTGVITNLITSGIFDTRRGGELFGTVMNMIGSVVAHAPQILTPPLL